MAIRKDISSLNYNNALKKKDVGLPLPGGPVRIHQGKIENVNSNKKLSTKVILPCVLILGKRIDWLKLWMQLVLYFFVFLPSMKNPGNFFEIHAIIKSGLLPAVEWSSYCCHCSNLLLVPWSLFLSLIKL
jgi:hypothetical protein